MVIPHNIWITEMNARVSVPNFYITSHLIGMKGWNQTNKIARCMRPDTD